MYDERARVLLRGVQLYEPPPPRLVCTTIIFYTPLEPTRRAPRVHKLHLDNAFSVTCPLTVYLALSPITLRCYIILGNRGPEQVRSRMVNFNTRTGGVHDFTSHCDHRHKSETAIKCTYIRILCVFEVFMLRSPGWSGVRMRFKLTQSYNILLWRVTLPILIILFSRKVIRNSELYGNTGIIFYTLLTVDVNPSVIDGLTSSCGTVESRWLESEHGMERLEVISIY